MGGSKYTETSNSPNNDHEAETYVRCALRCLCNLRGRI